MSQDIFDLRCLLAGGGRTHIQSNFMCSVLQIDRLVLQQMIYLFEHVCQGIRFLSVQSPSMIGLRSKGMSSGIKSTAF